MLITKVKEKSALFESDVLEKTKNLTRQIFVEAPNKKAIEFARNIWKPQFISSKKTTKSTVNPTKTSGI